MSIIQPKPLLIIEDDQAFAQTLMRRLTKYHYVCKHTADGNQTLLLARYFLPEIILLDMKLKNESGLNLITPLRNLLPNTRLILLTGFASIATAVDAIKMGADDYLAKPVDTKTLLAVIENRAINKISRCFNIEENQELTLSTEQVEWHYIQQILKANHGNVSATARQLAMHRRTLQRKLQKHPKL